MTALFIFGTGFYFLIMVIIGYLASRYINTAEDYLIAGQRLPFFLAVPTIVATFFGAGSCMGVSGMVYAEGFYGVIADPFGCALSLIIAGLFFAIPLRRLGLITISDLLSQAYGLWFERIATLLTLPFYIGTLASQMVAMGYIFHIVSGESTEWGILLGSIIVLVYTTTGGMWAVTITDCVQLVLLIVGLILIGVVCLEQTKDLPHAFSTFSNELTSLIPTTLSGTNWLAYLGRIFMIGLGAIMGQDLIQRLMASRDEKTARSSAITAGFLYLALAFIPLFVGITGRDIFPNLEEPEQLIPLLAKQYLSPVAFTVFVCGLLAAIMSTADSYLLAGTTLMVNNILFKIYPIKNEKNKIILLRWTNVIFALIALILAFSGQSIFNLMVYSAATLFVSILVPASALLFWKNNNPLAAWSAMIGGLIAWLSFIFINYASTDQYEELMYSAAFFGAIISLVIYLIIILLNR